MTKIVKNVLYISEQSYLIQMTKIIKNILYITEQSYLNHMTKIVKNVLCITEQSYLIHMMKIVKNVLYITEVLFARIHVWCFHWCQRALNRAKASERYRSQQICIVHGPVQGQLNTCKMNRLRWGLRAVGVPHVQRVWAGLVLSNINKESVRHHSHLSSVVPSFQIKFAPLLRLRVGIAQSV